MSDPFKLADSDLASSTWTRISRQIEERLQTLRLQNDSPLDPAATAHIRGAIAELKRLLSAAQKEPPPIDIG
jgi:hypothetical protein